MIMQLCAGPLPVDISRKPAVLVLLGQGAWQAAAARQLEPAYDLVLQSDRVWPGIRAEAPSALRTAAFAQLDIASVVGIWAGADGLLLDEWVIVGWLLAKRPQQLELGIWSTHPMAAGLEWLALQAGLTVFHELPALVSAVRDRGLKIR
jgi:hypothetical protein